jgi:VWFA-related protein
MKRLHFLLFSLLAAATLHAQTVAPSAGEPSATFKSQLPVVLVDVVVTNSHGDPVAGLKDADFQLFENGKRQTMASFEEHKTVVPTQVKLPLMPPGVFTNYPVVAAADCVNVLLIDGLNTSLMEDQSYVHEQILKYLKTLPRGAQVAIFTLTTRLRMLQEFTTDSSALLAAVNAAGLYKSPLVQERLEKEEQEEMLSFIEKSRAGPLPLQDWAHEAVDPAGALQAMFAEEASHLALTRLRTTLDSMQELARYLGFRDHSRSCFSHEKILQNRFSLRVLRTFGVKLRTPQGF